MKKKVLYVTILCLASFHAYTQVQNVYLDYYRSKLRINSKPAKTVDYKHIEGSPYLTDDFVTSKIFFRKDSVFEVPLRYNVFDQSMEYEYKNVVYAIGNPDIIEKIEMGEHIFIYFHNWDNTSFNCYYELLVSGKNYLLAKKEIELREAGPPKPIVESEPVKFFIRNDSYYIVKDASLPIMIKSKGSLIKILGDGKDEIKKFIKKEKISHKKREDLIKLVEYYNNL